MATDYDKHHHDRKMLSVPRPLHEAVDKPDLLKCILEVNIVRIYPVQRQLRDVYSLLTSTRKDGEAEKLITLDNKSVFMR